MRTSKTLICLFLIAACGGRPEGVHPSTIAPAETDIAEDPIVTTEPPSGQLPEGVTPVRYTLAMTVDPSQERFSGEVRIQLQTAAPTRQIWLHGNELRVESAEILREGAEPITGAWSQVDDNGLAVLRLDAVLAAGESTLVIRYDAPFNRALRGLYRVDESGDAYAFTQFEAISARLAFPCFDEPRFKTSFEATLTVRAADVAAFNTPEVDRQDAGEGMVRVRFAPTQPLPTYLLAMAVGPLDVVEHAALPATEVRPHALPFRGLAARGRGAEMAFAMEHTGALVEALERYFGMPYPYEKLDIVAVPDFAAGAMENAGLITFRDTLLLLAPEAPIGQQRAYAYVMAHELAHQWFGNLVTLEWWDDLWLNEAFATWMGFKIQDEVFPEHNGSLRMLSGVHAAMGTDSLVSARQIRQPIETSHDIRNAFDSITYRKGGGTLAMFERYLGADVFRAGVQAYMREHAHGTATYVDLLRALGAAAGRDVEAPFSTFLFQPGLPFVQVAVSCEGTPSVALNQSRYLPVGSSGSTEQTWRLPVCVRYGVGQEVKTACTLMTEAQASLELEGCPDWLMPNADGAGYYRFSMAADDLEKLQDRGFSQLTPAEQMAVADALGAAFRNGTVTVPDLLESTSPLAASPIRSVATMPMGIHAFLRDRVVDEGDRAKVTRASSRLYAPVARRLGWNVRRGEDSETTLLRANVLNHMALFVEDARIRREAVRRAEAYLGMGRRGDGEIHTDAVDPNLVGIVLAVAVQERGEAMFDALLERFGNTSDSLLRGRILAALAHTHDEALAERARALALSDDLRTNEVMRPLYVQSDMPETREATWAWVVTHFDALSRVLETGSGRLISSGNAFCSAEGAAQVEAFFTPRIEQIPGGPRTLATTLERVRLCGALVQAHRESAAEAF